MTDLRFSYKIAPVGFVRIYWPACYFPISVTGADLTGWRLTHTARMIEDMARQNDALEEITTCLLIARDELLDRGLIAA